MASAPRKLEPQPGERVVRCYNDRGVYIAITVGGVNSDQAAIAKAVRFAEGAGWETVNTDVLHT